MIMRMLIPHTDFRFQPDGLPSIATYRHFRGQDTKHLRMEIARDIRRERAKTAQTTAVEMPIIGITGGLFAFSAAVILLLRHGHSPGAGIQVVLGIISLCAFLGFVGTLLSAGATQSSYKAMLRRKKRFLFDVLEIAQSSADYEEFARRYHARMRRP